MANYGTKPSVLEAVGNGSYLYRFNIEERPDEIFPEFESGAEESRTSWDCDEVTVWAPLTANKITEAVIAAICPASHEQKLVNEYNAATLGLMSEEEAAVKIAAYKEFLEYRRELKAQVDADCAELDID